MVRFYHLLEYLEPLQNYEIEEISWSLQFYSFLKLLNKFLVWIVLRGEENFFNMSQLYTSTCNFKLSFQFLSFNLRYCTKKSENMPSIYKSTAKKTCQLIFCLDWICKINPPSPFLPLYHQITSMASYNIEEPYGWSPHDWLPLLETLRLGWLPPSFVLKQYWVKKLLVLKKSCLEVLGKRILHRKNLRPKKFEYKIFWV